MYASVAMLSASCGEMRWLCCPAAGLAQVIAAKSITAMADFMAGYVMSLPHVWQMFAFQPFDPHPPRILPRSCVCASSCTSPFSSSGSRLRRPAGGGCRGKDRAPVAFHIGEGPATRAALVECLVEAADMGVAVVGVFALGIGVVHDAHETRARAARGIFKHLLVAIGVAEGEDRATADEAVDADRLAVSVVDELDLGRLHQNRLAADHLELRHAARTDYLLGRDAVDLVGPRPHEVDAAARHDEGLEVVGAQIGE